MNRPNICNLKVCMLLLSRFSHVRLCATLEMTAYQVPPSLGFSRQEHWSGLSFPSPMHESEKWKVKVKSRHLQFPIWVAWHLPLSSCAPSRQWGSVSAISVAILKSSTFNAHLGFQMVLLWFRVPAPTAFSLLGLRSSCTYTKNSHYQWFLIYGFA